MKKLTSILLALTLMIASTSMVFGADEYVVKEGDTLAKIAAKYDTSYEELAKLNNIKNPHMIMVGDKLVVSMPEVAETTKPEPEVVVPEYTTEDLNEQLMMATLWVQNSAEFRALSYQTFSLAKMLVEKDLLDETVEEPRAIVVDLDETILDNSPYEAWLIGQDRGYSSSTWNPWIRLGVAPAMPGAVDFLKFCEENNVEVFYVSNRKVLDDNSGYEGTVKNLKALGLPNVDEEHVLLRTGSSNKDERRAIAQDGRHIVLYMGDNLNDFLHDFADLTVEERFAKTDEYKEEFGKKFVVMPNPMYGEWEGAMYEFNWGASAQEKDQMRKDLLNRWEYEVAE